jgi:hypothetical protein
LKQVPGLSGAEGRSRTADTVIDNPGAPSGNDPWSIDRQPSKEVVTACNGLEGDAAPDLSLPIVVAEVPESLSTSAMPAPTSTPHVTDEAAEERLAVLTCIPPSPAYEPEPGVRDTDLEAFIHQALDKRPESSRIGAYRVLAYR